MSASVSSSERFLVHRDLSCCHTLLCSHMTITSNIDHSPRSLDVTSHLLVARAQYQGVCQYQAPCSVIRWHRQQKLVFVWVSPPVLSWTFRSYVMKLPWFTKQLLAPVWLLLLNVSMIWVWTDVWDASWGSSCYQQALSSNHRSLTHFHI